MNPPLPRRRRPARRGMYILPSLFTAGSIGAGFYAIVQSLQGTPVDPQHFDYAALAIGFAIPFDGLDGRVARMTNTASEFGRELDSLADVITFGVAPAILAYSILHSEHKIVRNHPAPVARVLQRAIAGGSLWHGAHQHLRVRFLHCLHAAWKICAVRNDAKQRTRKRGLNRGQVEGTLQLNADRNAIAVEDRRLDQLQRGW